MGRKCSFCHPSVSTVILCRQDDSTLITLMRCLHHSNMEIRTARVAHHNPWVSQSKAVHVPKKSHSSIRGVWLCVHVKFYDPVPMQLFFSGAVKWSRSQGNHVVLAETSMIRLDVVNIKHVAHISANAVNGAKSIVCTQKLCVCTVSALWNKITTWNNFPLTAPFPNQPCVLFPTARTAHHFITPPAVFAQ